jgi:DNA-binding CsgD family transcriptional regulator
MPTALSHADLCAVVDSLREIYAETELGPLRERMLRVSSRLIGNEWASYNEVTRPGLKSLANFRIPDSVEIQKRAPDLFACLQEHPGINRDDLRTGEAYALSDFFSWHDFQRTSIYNEYYRHVGTRHQLFFTYDGGQGAPFQRAIAVNRKTRDFSQRDREILRMLGPHFRRAHSNLVELESLRSENTALKNAPRAATGITLTLTSKFRITGLNGSTREWFETHVGLQIRERGFLPEPLRSWLKATVVAHSRATDLAQLTGPLRIAGSGGFVVVRLAALKGDGESVLLLTAGERMPSYFDPKLAGLTRRENEILGWIVQGKSNPEIAQILGRSVRTVYKHVENLFAKLGVESRAQAMIKALEER